MGPPLIFSTGWNTIYLVNEIQKESNEKPSRPIMVFKFIVPKRKRTPGNEEND
jgi:hypothetical protein